MKQFFRRVRYNYMWHNCLRLWKWVSTQWVKEKFSPDNVWDLKKRWLYMHPFKIIAGGKYLCFFCEHARRTFEVNIGNRPQPLGVDEKIWTKCDYCPGRLVDPDFFCGNTQYHHVHHPELFYAKLVQLNALREQRSKT